MEMINGQGNPQPVDPNQEGTAGTPVIG